MKYPSTFMAAVALLAVETGPFCATVPDGSGVVTVLENPVRPANVVVPSRDLGATVDGLEYGDVAMVYTPANLKVMRGVGFGPLAYRLRTELAIEAWHWNPKGRWSDPARKQGYWTSDARPGPPINVSYGYRLPRRGSTIDQANNDGYSRIADGDEATFWKSNPYLDRRYTSEDNAKHPQWLVIDLGAAVPVNAIQIAWGVPYATDYRVEYWPISPGRKADGISSTVDGRQWKAFPSGLATRARGGKAFLKLCRVPLNARLIRVVLTASSGKAPKNSTDPRDATGYAIREIYAGTVNAKGTLVDAIRHAHSATGQTVIYASSTDPWHREKDMDRRIEQPGFDLLMRSGLPNKRPPLLPVGMLYDTPENGAAAMRYLRARGYPVANVELGEEPDGQFMTPDDYGALFVQWATALRKVNSKLVFGGPGFQTDVGGWPTWVDAKGDRSWTHQFLSYLASRKRSGDLGFFSFEWYPFDDVCGSITQQLLQEPTLLGDTLRRLWKEGVPRDMPMVITEYGYSSFAARVEVDIEAALMNADIVGQFLTLGGHSAYLYGYEPNRLLRESPACDTWGNLALFLYDDLRGGLSATAACWGAEMLMKDFLRGASKDHRIEACATDIRNPKGLPLVTAYSQRDPDGKRALLLVNKDPSRGWNVSVRLLDAQTGDIRGWRTVVEQVQFSRGQYVWKPDSERGRAVVNLPPRRSYILKPPGDGYHLPPYSLTVLREK
ncbi:MAG TPA: discoidin domain-containing protein [Armatimonadota bacterium]|jgi:hypothetical protein